MTTLSQTLVTEGSWAVAVARARLLTEAEPSLTEEEADALASTASAWLDQLAAEPFGSQSCAHVSSASDARSRVLYAVSATRDYLERNVRASAPLLALRAHIARTDARVSPECPSAEPDPVLSALLTHALELSRDADVTAPEAILCAELRTFEFRFAAASEHIDGCLRQPTFYAGARLCDEPRCGRAISAPLALHAEAWARGYFTSSGAHASSTFDVVLGRVDGVWRVLSEELSSQYCLYR